jgi:hypothetical protein
MSQRSIIALTVLSFLAADLCGTSQARQPVFVSARAVQRYSVPISNVAAGLTANVTNKGHVEGVTTEREVAPSQEVDATHQRRKNLLACESGGRCDDSILASEEAKEVGEARQQRDQLECEAGYGGTCDSN